MARNIKVSAIKNDEPALGLYVLALIALARQLQAEDQAHSRDVEPAAATSGESASGAPS